MDTTKQEIDTQKLEVLLNEYQETGLHLRHHDMMMVQWSAVFLTFTATLLSLSVVYLKNIPFFSFVVIAFTSILIVWITLIIVQRLTKFKDIGFNRLVDIEKNLGMKYYSQIQEGRETTKENSGSRYSTKDVAKIAFLAFVFIWVVLIVIRLLIEFSIL